MSHKVLARFNKLFNITSNQQEAQDEFINRVNQTIIDPAYNKYNYKTKFSLICYFLGENADDRIKAANRGNYNETRIPGLRTLTDDDFIKTLQLLVLYYSIHDDDSQTQDKISNYIEVSLKNSLVDLGIRWRQGMFYPSGAKNLDQDLIDAPFDWLAEFKDIQGDFREALGSYYKKNYPAAVDHCYLAVEELTRKILRNNKVIKNNFDGLLKAVNLSNEWKGILNKWYFFANEYKRHASSKRSSLVEEETEAFIYLTGIILRLVLKKGGDKND